MGKFVGKRSLACFSVTLLWYVAHDVCLAFKGTRNFPKAFQIDDYQNGWSGKDLRKPEKGNVNLIFSYQVGMHIEASTTPAHEDPISARKLLDFYRLAKVGDQWEMP